VKSLIPTRDVVAKKHTAEVEWRIA
jgi:hypothetical protein